MKKADSRCVLLDARDGGKLVGCWLQAVRQALDYEPMTMSIVSVHSDYYAA